MIVRFELAPKLVVFCSHDMDCTYVYMQQAASGCLQFAGNV